MSAISDSIEKFILTLLEEDDAIELQRNERAHYFSCAPSQINYVLATRFNLGRGYAIESRRGGGGYIKITRVRLDAPVAIMHTVNCVGDAADMQTCRAHILNLHHGGVLDAPSARLMLAALGDNALRAVPAQLRDGVRASIFKQMLLTANGKDDR